MLIRSQLMTLALGALAINAAACVLTTTTDGVGGFGGSGTTSSTTATTSSTTSSTTTSSTTTSSSSTGGGCTNPTGTGKAESACDQHGFPSVCSNNNQAPLAAATCHKGFTLYTPGSWEELDACFGNIPVTTDDLCVDPTATNNVTACLTTMYSHACANTDADTACDNVNTACQGSGAAFDVANCKADLLPFSNGGVNLYIDCINAHPNDACDTLHTTCFDAVTAL